MMMKHVLGALGTVAALSLVLAVSMPANAQSTSYVPPTTSSSPSTPPDNPGTPNGGPAGGPDLPPPPPEQQISQLEQVCNAALNKLAKVPPKLVVAFANEAGVSVVPVCNSGLGHKAKDDRRRCSGEHVFHHHVSISFSEGDWRPDGPTLPGRFRGVGRLCSEGGLNWP